MDKQLLKIAQAFAHPLRIKVISNLVKAANTSVKTNIRQAFSPNVPHPSAISHHLKILERAGIVTRHKEGREVFLSLNIDVLETLSNILLDLKSRVDS